MNTALVTGGNGHLGRKVVDSLVSMGSKVRVLTTRALPPGGQSNITYHTGNLAEDIGLNEAVADVDTIIHCASNSANFREVDIHGTENLLRALAGRTIKHFVYISIVGVDKSDYPYYKAKLEVEKIVSGSGVPYSIVRTTQFHHFVWNMIKDFIDTASQQSIIKIPAGLKFQSISTEEVAELLAETCTGAAKGLLPGFGGPEILSFEEMTAGYLKAFKLKQEIEAEMTNEKRHELFRSGVNLCPGNSFGKQTWEKFLETIYKK